MKTSHLQQLVSIDFFTVPTIRFQVLYVFLVLGHDRRRILHCNVTAHPTAEWTGQQLREAFPFDHGTATYGLPRPDVAPHGPGPGRHRLPIFVGQHQAFQWFAYHGR
jgi:hypothetical protein